jgi:hypothetical protein
MASVLEVYFLPCMPSVAIPFPFLKKLSGICRIAICPLLLLRGHIAVFQD